MAIEKGPSLTNKIALEAGGSRGFGCGHTVLHLAKRGVQSTLTYNTNQSEAEQTVAEAPEAEAKAMALRLGVGDVHFVRDFRNALASLGSEHFDFLVNSAGVSHHALRVSMKELPSSAVPTPWLPLRAFHVAGAIITKIEELVLREFAPRTLLPDCSEPVAPEFTGACQRRSTPQMEIF